MARKKNSGALAVNAGGAPRVLAAESDVERGPAKSVVKELAADATRLARATASAHATANGTELARDAEDRRALRGLSDRVLAALRPTAARTVLVTSARAREGRSRLSTELARDLAGRVEGGATVLAASELLRVAPGSLEGLVLIDGPALLEGEGSLAVPDAWWSALDGAIVVALARETSESDLAVGGLLATRCVPRLALVWNEARRPPLARALSDLVQRVLSTFRVRSVVTAKEARR